MTKEVAEEFGIDEGRAKQMTREVVDAVSTWRDEAARMGMHRKAIERMETAFVHRDLELAKRFSA